MKDNKTKEKFIQLRADGLSFEKIAAKLGVSKQTLINWSKEYSSEVSNLTACRLEAIQEQYEFSLVERIRSIAESCYR